jgi:hypothetical protein
MIGTFITALSFLLTFLNNPISLLIVSVIHIGLEAVGKRPSAALLSSLVTAAYFYVRLIPRDIGSLASEHFPSASEKPVFRQFL